MYLCQTLIDNHAFDKSVVDNNGWTALHCSAQSGNYELFRYFVDKGTDVYQKTKKGHNCLHIAARNGHLYLCQTLIDDHGFDENIVDNNGWAALHNSAESGNYELFRYFVDKGTDVHQKTKKSHNCLDIAAHKGHLNLCQTLIDDHDFDKNIVNNNGWTALYCSAKSGNYELVRHFVEKGADIHQKTKDGDNCLHIAARKGHLNLCKALIDKYRFEKNVSDKKGVTPILDSVESGNYELVKFFIEKGADIHVKTLDGFNCLHIAACSGDLNLCKIFIDEHGFQENTADIYGRTPLHFSAGSGNFELFKFFLDRGADIYLKANDGTNCLHFAAEKGKLNICKFLLEEHKFDIHYTNNEKFTALHLSAGNGSFALFSYLLEKGSEIYSKTKNMRNVLHFSTFYGHFDISEFVLKHFMTHYEDNNIRAQYELNGKTYSSQVFYKYNCIFLHAMDAQGNTYLHLAAAGNQQKICKLLLDYDTEFTTLLNKEGKTARDIAMENDFKDVLNVLKAHYDREGIIFSSFNYIR